MSNNEVETVSISELVGSGFEPVQPGQYVCYMKILRLDHNQEYVNEDRVVIGVGGTEDSAYPDDFVPPLKEEGESHSFSTYLLTK